MACTHPGEIWLANTEGERYCELCALRAENERLLTQISKLRSKAGHLQDVFGMMDEVRRLHGF